MTTQDPTTPVNPLQEREDRLATLAEIRARGVHPYPEKFQQTHHSIDCTNVSEDQLFDLEDLKARKPATYALAGRIMMQRAHGKLSFAILQDEPGRIQLAFMQDMLGEETYSFIKDCVHLGDWVGVQGDLFRTKHGEITLLVTKFTFLGKALRPMPDKFHGLENKETKYRQRYLDLIANEETRERFRFRSNFLRSLREFYWKENFMEVETPTFLETATGAAANPYRTHNDALDIDLVLRISHELPLKKLIVGGYEKIFEIGKVFRNEGIDPSHLPEHTHIEHYAAFWNFEDNIAFTERMFDHIFEDLQLDRKRPIRDKEGQERIIDFSTPWARVDYIKLFENDGFPILSYTKPEEVLEDLKKRNITIEGAHLMGLTTLLDHVYKKLYRPHIINPTVVFNYPTAMQPLARKSDKDGRTVDQFQLVVNGWEVVKAYSELVDPIDQMERFVDQASAKEAGDSEAMEMEEDYITAMEYGMPPISGWGMGVDRITTLLTGQENLRDLVFFPMMRPKD
ncbi:lysine--tRNA ligase [Candidatus Gracilibacteria bacterium CG17_big_fil_post_rev_8_21_14_2_50_48_13]|nr:MAG: lysine--tRNA ligase [Candidatus Gracilibacteria bacterium CG17_big_fil_post_rev_8_21_14_2_50_48_13]